jgi:hypothetical protein
MMKNSQTIFISTVAAPLCRGAARVFTRETAIPQARDRCYSATARIYK